MEHLPDYIIKKVEERFGVTYYHSSNNKYVFVTTDRNVSLKEILRFVKTYFFIDIQNEAVLHKLYENHYFTVEWFFTEDRIASTIQHIEIND